MYNDIYACKCGCGLNNISLELLKRINEIQKIITTELTIIDACRCEKYNNKVHGISNSTHVKGLGIDIALANDRDMIIDMCKKYFNRIGIGSNHIHVDIDKTKPNAIWFIN